MSEQLTENAKLVLNSIEKLMAAFDQKSADQVREILQGDKHEQPRRTLHEQIAAVSNRTSDPRIDRLQATGMSPAKVAFIKRAWANAEKFGLKIDDATGFIVGGVAAVDKAFRENRSRFAADDIRGRVQLKSEFLKAGILGGAE
jgi:hypothetical protein